MTTADTIQHGGTHYKAAYEHWNLVADLQLNYYQACGSKYITRHRKKNGREDILKAKHYIDKYIELMQQWRVPHPVKLPQAVLEARLALFEQFVVENDMALDSSEGVSLRCLCIPQYYEDVTRARYPLNDILDEYDAGPTKAYVNQG